MPPTADGPITVNISELSETELAMLEQRMIVLEGMNADHEQPELGLLERGNQ